MNINGLGIAGYPAGYRSRQTARGASPESAGVDFMNRINQASQTQKPLVLHGKKDADEGETAIFSKVDVSTGISAAVYKGKDFDESSPVYRVKIWDADGNMTEREVDISKVDPKNCDEMDMFAYAAHLSASGQYPQAYLKLAAAKAYAQGNNASSYSDAFQKIDWVALIQDFMQMQYDVGNRKGYLEYKKFLEFLV